jgi:hypothetical protein
MSKAGLWRRWLALLLAAYAVALLGAPVAQGAPSDPLFVFTPAPAAGSSVVPPPFGFLEGPCGMGVDPTATSTSLTTTTTQSTPMTKTPITTLKA